MDNNKPIHPLQKLRTEKGLTQADLAQILNVSKNMLSQIESQGVKIPSNHFFSLCEMFEIDPSVFQEMIAEFKKKWIKYVLDH